MPVGAMAALGVGEDKCRELMTQIGITDVDIAASNTLDNVTIAGIILVVFSSLFITYMKSSHCLFLHKVIVFPN